MMKARLREIAVLTLLGIPAYVLCYIRHSCMCGHMQHGPLRHYDWINDAWSLTCWVSILVLSVRLEAKRKMWFLCGSLVLVTSRLPLGDVAGACSLFEIPLLLVMTIYAVLYLTNPAMWIINTKRVEPTLPAAAAPDKSS